jgi:hypothetical protein
MIERDPTKGWHKVEVGNTGRFIDVKDVDPKILALMPISGRNFLEVGPIEWFVNELKKLVRGKPNDLFP